ncbi:ATPase, T2SS/T4P/T4SS family [Serratia symbiotica]|uniref:ATPase, T2SS/T4P/T4SS family n=1 Tax=Serratia symbiotica TaxID=138074 RepID=UPI00132970A5|nr:ATPase, T2SS/T4P/T4SS family [Serratia symbiotica]QTP13358.1 Flp pilus assembly complex ATPase component TadA [Serratia symbiotica]
MASNLRELEFIDLYLSTSFADYHDGNARFPIPDNLKDEVDNIKAACLVKCEKSKLPEFALQYDDVRYRVTVIFDFDDKHIFFLRKIEAQIRKLNQLNLVDSTLLLINNKDLEGLILVAGKMRQGKTTTAASLVSHRLHEFGGVSVAIEDPTETLLAGLHGKGRCIQAQASRFSGGYQEPLIRSLRTGADMIFIGEIREPNTAKETAVASINGHLIISTIHAGSVGEAIEKYCALAGNELTSSLAEGLTLVIFQTLVVSRNEGVITNKSLETICFRITDSVRTKIKEGKFSMLKNDIQQQISQEQWS